MDKGEEGCPGPTRAAQGSSPCRHISGPTLLKHGPDKLTDKLPFPLISDCKSLTQALCNQLYNVKAYNVNVNVNRGLYSA